ncbi:hypothetical protein MN116_002570 [Schistosoma mekongi]|uniref:diacylglycerol kinase (ATP) n=1 Tax=Schistosoma mekongi TaxID=38744 RepID=A0AAE2D6P6_SCHME|nr:hypothetical protein MN116_002570 [Schistosoma mekongi]
MDSFASETEADLVASSGSASEDDAKQSSSYKSSSIPKGWFQGHSFMKKNLHKPATCHHCSDLLWGILGTTGMVCEVCNFLAHEKCIRAVVTACTCIAPFLTKDPVPHCWSEIGHFKRKFCNVCRKRVDDLLALKCEICEYYSHYECLDFVSADCKQCAISTLTSMPKSHHWREGNLPVNSKCASCRKTCWSAECLTGIRCEWCCLTAHYSCYKNIPTECDFGVLRNIMLPPYCVSVPRTSLLVEQIIGMCRPQPETLMGVQALTDEFSSNGDSPEESGIERKSTKDKTDRDFDDYVRVYDGWGRFRKKQCRYLSLGRSVSVFKVIELSLKAFQLPPDEARDYYLVEINEKAVNTKELVHMSKDSMQP